MKSDAFDVFDEIFFGKSTQKRRRGSASVGIYQEGKTTMSTTMEREKQTKTAMQTAYTMQVLNESMEVITGETVKVILILIQLHLLIVDPL